MEKNTRCILMAGGGGERGERGCQRRSSLGRCRCCAGRAGRGGGGMLGDPLFAGLGDQQSTPPPPLAAGICSWVASREVVQCSPPPPPL